MRALSYSVKFELTYYARSQRTPNLKLLPVPFRSRYLHSLLIGRANIAFASLTMVETPPTLAAQTFACNALNRSTTSRKDADFLPTVTPSVPPSSEAFLDAS